MESAKMIEGAACGTSDLTDVLGLPPVLDACCGSRMFWFDRKDSRATFVDKRRERHTLPDISSKGGSRELVIDHDRMIKRFRNIDMQKIEWRDVPVVLEE